jgi:CRISPR-associated protein Csb1
MLTQFDSWLKSNGPVALSIKEPIEPAAGGEAVFFPPTFAPPEGSDKKPGYVINKNRVCLVDTVGSQANRLEPLFKRRDLADLTPRFTVKAGDREINILDAGHRAADAIVRFSDQWQMLRAAFLAYRDKGDAQLLAKAVPTSLVFGVWDSRDTYAKVPRLIESTIRAFGVERLTRSAQYFSALEKEEVLEMELDGLGQKTLSGLGISDSPSGRVPGGVIARDGIIREALLNLVALRALGTEKEDDTIKLQRYILGLSLIAFLAPAQLYLRQGCVLVACPDKPTTKRVVWRDGKREDFDLAEQQVLDFARSAASEFGVGPEVDATFRPERVKAASDEKAAKKGNYILDIPSGNLYILIHGQHKNTSASHYSLQRI